MQSAYLTVTVRGQHGHFNVEHGHVTVWYQGQSKTTQVGGGHPLSLAMLLLSELLAD